LTRGQLLTLWSVRIACILYVGSLVAWLLRKPQPARLTWTLAFFFYLAHVTAAFAFYHGWSHKAAYAETARQTSELFGVRSGAGLYLNYVFTGIWAGDVFWMWANAGLYRSRPRWLGVVIHSFFALMFFNATIVFASGWVRWLGVTAALLLGAKLLIRFP